MNYIAKEKFNLKTILKIEPNCHKIDKVLKRVKEIQKKLQINDSF